VKFDKRALEKIMRAFKDSKGPSVAIGIMGSSTRSDGQSNAVVGAAHEFGTSRLPKRSFLREPITENLDKKLYAGGKFSDAEMKQVIREAGLKAWLNRIAILSEQVVQEAFDTAFGGRWKRSNMKYKKNHQTLVESQQLRNAITSEVRE